MSRRFDRPATLAALTNALVVYVLPAATVMVLVTVRFNGNGATVVGVDPDRAVALAHRLQMLGGYIAFMSPFAMAAGLSAIVGLAIGVILWASAAAALKLMTFQKA